MAEFKLGRIKFVYQGTWTTSTTYVVDDVVTNGGKTYICVLAHTSSALFATDLAGGAGTTKWNLIADGQSWKGTWGNSTLYNPGDLVEYGSTIYQCTTANTSVASTLTITATGLALSSGTATLTFANQTSGIPFVVGQQITLSGFSPSQTSGTVNNVNTTFTVLTCSNTNLTFALTGTYVLATPGTVSGTGYLESQINDWTVFASNLNWSNAWATSTKYKINDFVYYGGVTYVCNTAHISASTATAGLESNSGFWSTFNAGLNYIGTWTSATRYKLNDIVKYGADLWICTVPHTSSGSTINTTNFSMFVNGLEFQNSWSNSINYAIGDLVTYGGYTYTAIQNNIGQVPSTQTAYWQIFTTGLTFSGAWVSGTAYKIGDIVTLGGFTYVAAADNTGSQPATGNANWSQLNPGIRWAQPSVYTYSGISGINVVGTGTAATFDITLTGTTYSVVVHTGQAGGGYSVGNTIKILGTNLGGLSPANDIILTVATVLGNAIATVTVTSGFAVTWRTGITYLIGDAVYYGNSSYICVSSHVGSTGVNDPVSDTSATYWNILAQGANGGVLTSTGDMVYFGANGATRLPIGTDGQILRVNGNVPSWAYYGLLQNIVYVAPTGQDIVGNSQGQSLDKPWASLLFACKQIEDGYLNTNAGLALKINKQFMLKEVNNWILNQYSFNVTGSSVSGNTFIVGGSSTSSQTTTANMYYGMPITFTTAVTSQITPGTVYYVNTIPSATTFTISTSYKSGATLPITGGSSTSGTVIFSYTQSKAERDAGTLIDAVIFDLTHGGNLYCITATQAFFSTLTSYITTNAGYEMTVWIASLQYLENTLFSAVLTNSPPQYNYQTTQGIPVSSQAIQNTSEIATSNIEQGALTTVKSLLSIVTNALAAGTYAGNPLLQRPHTSIYLKTGTYNEYGPIVVPQDTAILGDELRSTIVQVASAQPYLGNDTTRTASALRRIQWLLPAISANIPVIPTSTNTATQQYLGTSPYGTFTSNVNTNVTLIQTILAGGLSAVPGAGTTTITITAGSITVPNTGTYTLTTPVGFGSTLSNIAFACSSNATGSTVGYDGGIAQIQQNISFIQTEIAAFMNANYNSVWTAMGSTNQGYTLRDVGYLLNSIIYDMNYGGNTQSQIDGLAYYSLGTASIISGYQAATVAMMTRLQSIIPYIVTANTGSWTKTSGNTASQVTSGAAGSTNAATFATGLVTTVLNWVNSTNGTGNSLSTGAGLNGTIPPCTSWVNSANLTAFNNIQTNRTAIQTWIKNWVANDYPAISSSLTYRDAGTITDALSYDLLLGSNYFSMVSGRAFYRLVTSAENLVGNVNNELTVTEQAINYIGAQVAGYANGSTTPAGASGSAINLGNSQVIPSLVANSQLLQNILSNGLTYSPVFGSGSVIISQSALASVVNNSTTGIAYTSTTVALPVGTPITITRTSSGTAITGNLTIGGVAISAIASGASVTYYTGSTTTATSTALYANYANAIASSSPLTIGGTTTTGATFTIGITTPTAGTFTLTTPTGFNTSSLTNTAYSITGLGVSGYTGNTTGDTTGYGYGAANIAANISFLQTEIANYLNAYTGSGFSWNALSAVNQGKTLRDLSYILQSVQYDMTYGGNLQSQTQGVGYYSLGVASLSPASTVAASIASLTRLQTIIPYIVNGTTVGWTPSTGNTATQVIVTSGTYTNAATYAQALIGNIINWINGTNGTGNSASTGIGLSGTVLPCTSWVSASAISAFNAINAQKSYVQTQIQTFVATQYPNNVTNLALTYRDAGTVVDTLNYDMLLGSNYFTLVSGRSFYKAVSSAQALVSSTELSATEIATQYIAYYISGIATQALTLPALTGDFGNPAAVNLVVNNTAIIQNMFANGLTITPGIQNNTNYGANLGIVQEPAFNMPTVANYNTYYLVGYGYAVTQLQNNYQFIKDEIVAYLIQTIGGSTWANYGPTYQAETIRDLSNILDALQYDMTYGCNDQSLIAGRAFYSLNTPLIVSPYTAGVTAALNRLAAIISSIVTANAISPTSGNTTSQSTSGTAGSAAAGAFAVARVADVQYWLANGVQNTTTGVGTATFSGTTMTVSAVASGTFAVGQAVTGTTLTTTATAVNGSTGVVTLTSTVGLASGMPITFSVAYGSGNQGLFGNLSATTYTINAVVGSTVTLYNYGTTTAPSLTTATGQLTVTAGVAPGTYITSIGSTGGGTGAYTVSVSQTLSTATTVTGTFTITPVVSGAFNFASPANQLSFNAIQAQATLIANDAQAWVTRFFQNEGPSLSLTNRDAAYVVTALSYDVLFGSNFYSIINGRAFNRLIPSIARLQGNYADSAYGAIGFIGQKIKVIASAGSAVQTQTTIDDMIAQIYGQPITTCVFNATVNGTQLIVNNITSGAIVPGMPISGIGVATGTSTVSGATTTLSGIYISSNTGVFGCTALTSPLVVGQQVTITGTFSAGSISGYTSGTIYYVIGSPTTTLFQLSATQGGTALTTVAAGSSGSPLTGITFVASPTTWLLNYSQSVSSTVTSIQNIIPTSNLITMGTTAGMVPGLSITITGTAIGNLTAGTYYIKQVLNTTQLTISSSYNGSVFSVTPLTTLSGVTVTSSAGTFTCTAASTTLTTGLPVTISGTNTGSGGIYGYSSPTTYYIVNTNGSTTFTLSASIGGSAIVTTVGTPTGWTFAVGSQGSMVATVYGIYSGLALTTNLVGTSTNIPVTAVTTSTNAITLSSDAGVYINMPVVFSGLPNNINTTAISTTTSTNVITLAASASSLGIVAGQQVYFTGMMLGKIVFNQNYYVINPTGSTIQISNTLGGSAVSLTSSPTLSTVAITGTSGQFSCASYSTLYVGQAITINGTLSAGTINTNSTITAQTFYIIATNGSTTFTLSATLGGVAIVTTTSGGTITGTTFGVNAQMNVVVNTAGGLVNGDTYWVNSVASGTYPAAGTTITVSSSYKSGTAVVITNSLTGLTATASIGLYTNQGIASKIVNGMSQVWGNPTNSYQSYPGYNNTMTTIMGAELFRLNKSFLAGEAAFWTQANYGSTSTSTTSGTNIITTSTPHNLLVNDPVQFGLTGSIFEYGLNSTTIYWVLSTPSSTTFTVTTTQPGTGAQSAVSLSGGTGAMGVNYYIITSKATRDAGYHVDAMIYDLALTGNYKSTRSVQLYLSAANGALYTNLFHVRNGTGIRNMTLNGMGGTLSLPNSLGTKRPTGGIYTSLDPGFGPNDSSVWEFIRSCYIQNVTNFGNGCVGLKIDAALHNGGNRSILANDYTQVLSDGIGVYCTGHGALTECVSVFNYYCYSGYFAEYGGRIRATNGNSSYGTFGAVAEGTDSYEIPGYSTINNRGNPAYITNVVTDATNYVFRLEFENAGSAYTNYVPTISGAGYNAVAIGDEFRDSAVFESRLIDLNNGTGVGGSNYLTISNTAQSGTVGQITIANSDTQLSTAYIGMRVFLTGGTGVGQYGIALNYTFGSKIINVYRQNFVPLTIISNSTSVFTVSTNTNTMYANQPIYLSATIAGLTFATVYYVVGSTLSNNGTTFSLSTSSGGGAATLTATSSTPAVMNGSTIVGTTLTVGTLASGTIYAGMLLSGSGIASNTYISANISGSGNGSTWTVTTSQNLASTNITGTISVQLYEAGWDHAVPGYATANVLDATTTYIIEPMLSYSSPGFTATTTSITSGQYGSATYGSGSFVATSSPGIVTSYSTNGSTWNAGGSLPSNTAWNNVVYGGGQGAKGTAVIGGLGGSGAILSAILGSGSTAGQIIGINIINGGNNYSTPPTIVITDSTGNGAVAIAEVLSGVVTNVYMNITGSLYSSSPTVTAITSELSGITVNSWGNNYFSNPTVTIAPPFNATSWVSGGTVVNGNYYYNVDTTVSPNVTNYYQAGATGTFSSTAPTFTNKYYGKSGASATGIGASGTYGVALTYVGSLPIVTANLTTNGVSSYTVVQAGFGYSTIPTVTVVDPYAAYAAISGSSNAFAYNTGAPTASIQVVVASSSGTTITLAYAVSLPQNTPITFASSFGAGPGVTASTTYYVAATTSSSTSLTLASSINGSAITIGTTTGLAIIGTTSNSTTLTAAWLSGSSTGLTTLKSLAYGNNYYIAVGGSGSAAAVSLYNNTSLASASWVNQSSSITANSSGYTAVAYGAGLFCAIGGTVSSFMQSNPTSWATGGTLTSKTWASLAYGNGRFVALATDGTLQYTYNWQPSLWTGTSATNNTWITVKNNPLVTTGVTTWSNIKYAEGLFVAISSSPNEVFTATSVSGNNISVSNTTGLVAGATIIPTAVTEITTASATTHSTASSLGIIGNGASSPSAGTILTPISSITGTYAVGALLTSSGTITAGTYITASNSFTSTSSTISGSTLTVGGTITGTVSVGQQITGPTFSNTSAIILNSYYTSASPTNVLVMPASAQTGTTFVGGLLSGSGITANTTYITGQTTSTGTISIAIGSTANITASISGTTLTVTANSGTINIGMVLGGGTVAAGTFIVANSAGTTTSSVSVWTVNISQSATVTTATPYTATVSSASGTFFPGMTLTGGTATTGTIVTAQVSSTAGAGGTQNYSSGGAAGASTVTLAAGTGFAAGQLITGNGIFANTYITSVAGAVITISQPFYSQASGSYTSFTASSNGGYYVTPAQTGTTATGGNAYTVTSGVGFIATTTISGQLNSYIVATGSGSGGAGTYTINNSVTISSGTTINGQSYTVSTSQLTTSATITGTLDSITVGSTAGMAIGEPIVFSGTTGGGITNGSTYYITEIISSTALSVGSTYLATSNVTVNGSTPPSSVVAGGLLGGLTSGNTYYIASINSGANTIQVSTSSTLSPVLTLSGGVGAWTAVAGEIGGGNNYVATSWDGLNWYVTTMPALSSYQGLAFGNPQNATLGAVPTWVAVSSSPGTTAALIQTGARPLGRVKISSSTISEVRMIEPGSGFPRGNVSGTTSTTNLIIVDSTVNLAANMPVVFNGTSAGNITTGQYYYVVGGTITSTTFQISLTAGSSAIPLTSTTITGMTYFAGPTITIVDPNHVNSAPIVPRIGNGVLGNPSFTNRGVGETTATSIVSGDGYSDLYQIGNYINVSGLYSIPSPGSNVTFATITGSAQWYKLVAVTNQLGIPGNYTATFQINPAMSVLLAPPHGTQITTRLLYSNTRMTGHDFLYIGTGGFTSTNYPNVDPSKAVTANQTFATGGGRVFFTSTDQDGNFNVGNLFGVQQSTGTATLNASAFNLSGLQSLTLGSVSLGVGSATITQFSTDPYFTANSDAIVPTQKAIKAYITSQIGGGQSALNVNTITSGQIYIAGNTISTTTGNQIYVSSKMLFTGGIDGAPVALSFFGQK